MAMRVWRLMFASVAVLAGVLVLNTAPAGAKTGYAKLCPSLKTALCTTRTEEYTWGVAVDNSSGPSAGDVWVAYQISTGLRSW